MKNKTALLLVGALAVFLSACGPNKAAEAVKESEEIEKEGKSSESEEKETETEEAETEEEAEPEEAVKVGILLPEEGTKDEEYLSQKFEEAGYEAEILTAGNDTETQIQQIQTLVESEAAAIVVNPVDAYGLSEAFAEAQEKEIPVFSYDKLVMNTELVKYYAAFDTRAEGRLVGETIVKLKDLEAAREEKLSYTIEFLMGTPEDVRELFFYNGILEVLQEYLDDGTLVCKSGKLTFDDTSVMRGSETAAKSRFQSILDEFYVAEGGPDIICTASDKYTYTISELLESRDINAENENLPLITGFGSEAEAIKAIAEGKVGFTLFQDRSELADICVKMVDGYLTGNKVEVDNYSQYDNGKKIIGAYTCEAELIDGDNYQIMVDNGTYTEEEIMPKLPTPTPTPAQTMQKKTDKETQPTGTPVPTEGAKPSLSATPSPSETLTATPTPKTEGAAVPASKA